MELLLGTYCIDVLALLGKLFEDSPSQPAFQLPSSTTLAALLIVGAPKRSPVENSADVGQMVWTDHQAPTSAPRAPFLMNGAPSPIVSIGTNGARIQNGE